MREQEKKFHLRMDLTVSSWVSSGHSPLFRDGQTVTQNFSPASHPEQVNYYSCRASLLGSWRAQGRGPEGPHFEDQRAADECQGQGQHPPGPRFPSLPPAACLSCQVSGSLLPKLERHSNGHLCGPSTVPIIRILLRVPLDAAKSIGGPREIVKTVSLFGEIVKTVSLFDASKPLSQAPTPPPRLPSSPHAHSLGQTN